jgi:heat shock protein HslJ
MKPWGKSLNQKLAAARPASFLALILILMMLVAACGTGKAQKLPDPAVTSDWLVTSLNGSPPSGGINLTAIFGNDGRLTGSAGCNTYATTYEILGNSVIMAPLEITSDMQCEASVMAQEDTFLIALAAAKFYKLGEGNESLILEDGNGATILEFEGGKATTLEGTPWQVRDYFSDEEQQASVPILPDTEITAVFELGGDLTGSAGCNTYQAPYEGSENRLNIGPVSSTEMACLEPDGIMAQESQYLAALAMATTFQIVGDALQLTTDDGTLVVTLVAAE